MPPTDADLKQAVKRRLLQIVLSFLDMLGSKKFQTAFAASVAIYIETRDLAQAAIPMGFFIVGQGIADAGKERAKAEKS